MPALAIVVVTFNSRREIDGCLQSLRAHPPAIEHEIVVVDNASTDGTAGHVHQQWPQVRLIETGANLGFGRGSNAGIRATSGSLVLLLNPDARVPAAAIDRLAGHLAAQPDVAIVGPRIVDGEGRPELSFGPMISPLAELRQKVLLTGNDRGLPVVSGLVARMTRRTRDVDWVSGGCLLARREDIEAAGLFDERYFLYAEDVDLCAAVRARGKRVQFVADVEIVHLRGRSGAADPAAAHAAYRRSHVAFYEKHHPAMARLLVFYLKIRGQLPDTS